MLDYLATSTAHSYTAAPQCSDIVTVHLCVNMSKVPLAKLAAELHQVMCNKGAKEFSLFVHQHLKK